MEPSLLAGDWLLVDPSPDDALVAGDVLVAHDPRAPGRLLVKRCASTTGGQLMLTGDHPAHATDRIGPVERADVIGRAWFRYWPPGRIGRVR